MNVQQAQQMILAGFAYMSTEQRKAMLRFLKLAKPKLDFDYPNGAVIEEEKQAVPSLILPKQ
jgi:hypothetical protein